MTCVGSLISLGRYSHDMSDRKKIIILKIYLKKKKEKRKKKPAKFVYGQWRSLWHLRKRQSDKTVDERSKQKSNKKETDH